MRIVIGKKGQAHTSYNEGLKMMDEYSGSTHITGRNAFLFVQEPDSVITKAYLRGIFSRLLGEHFYTYRFNVEHLSNATRLQLKEALIEGRYNHVFENADKPFTKENGNYTQTKYNELRSIVTRSRLTPTQLKPEVILCSVEPIPTNHLAAVACIDGEVKIITVPNPHQWKTTGDLNATVSLMSSGLNVGGLRLIPFELVPTAELKIGHIYSIDDYTMIYYHPEVKRSNQHLVKIKGI